MKIFSGSSNPNLVRKVARELKIKVGKIELRRFSNDEARVWVKDSINNSAAVVLQSFSIPVDQHIIQFCLICDALKRLGAKKITAVIPWLGYSKQDKVFRDGEPLSVKVIVKIVQTAPFSKLITFDLHNQAIIGFFDKPVKQLSAIPLFLEYFKRIIKKDNPCSPAKTVLENFMVVAPDAGSIKSSTEFANELGIEVAYIDKKRDLTTGEITIRGISREVSGKKILIIDDMVVTGSTLIEAAKFLKKQGAKKIFVAATHHLYLDGVQKKLEKNGIDKTVVSDTISPRKKISSSKLKILSIDRLIAKALKE